MKHIYLVLSLFLTLISYEVSARNSNLITQFNHTGIQKGAISESCYREPCVVAKVLSFENISHTANTSRIKLILLGGERAYESKSVSWNKKPHTLIVNCSLSRPVIEKIGQQPTLIPLGNPSGGVPGALVGSAELYLKACHNFTGTIEDAVSRFGYQVQE